MSTQILLWALEAQAGSCPVRKTRPSARLQRIPRASSPEIPSVFDWPNTGWNGFTLALLSDGNQPNPPRRKMLSRLNASNNWVHEGCGERLCCRCRGSRFGAPQIRKDGASSRRMRDTLSSLQACTVCPSSGALSGCPTCYLRLPQLLLWLAFIVSGLVRDRAMW